MEASREACEMHEGQNAETSSRHQAQIHLESHVHGKRACVVWGRADEKGPSHRYLVSRLFHSATPTWNAPSARNDASASRSSMARSLMWPITPGSGPESTVTTG